MEYYLTVKRNEALMIHATILMNLENITLSERSQSKDHIWYGSTYMKCPDRQFYRDRKISGCLGLKVSGVGVRRMRNDP